MRPSIVTLISLVAICGPLLVASQDGREIASVMASKLSQFAEDPSRKSTGFTYDDYETFHRSVNEAFSKEELDKRRQVSPLFRLIEDFILLPMDRWRPSSDDEDITKIAYVARMEQTFKHYYPAYVEASSIGDKLVYNAKKFWALVNALHKRTKDKPTIDKWRLAIKEYEALKKKATEIALHEDIYEQLYDYELLMNFFNFHAVKTIMTKFAPLLNNCKTEADLDRLVAEYRKLYRVQ